MKREDAEKFTQSLGQIVGGSWGQIELAKRLGVPQALDLSVEEWVHSRLGGYVKQTVDDRRQAVAKLKADGASLRDMGEVLGVSQMTAKRDLDAVTNVTENAPELADSVTNVTPVDAVAALAQMPDATSFNHRAVGTGENEWYTPGEYIAKAKTVLGEIDLDPASSERAQAIVGAKQFFSVADNGLVHAWVGRVWLNPPYSQPEILHFMQKLVDELQSGCCTEAIALTHNFTDTAWFHIAAKASQAICFTKGRIKFINSTGKFAAPTNGQTFFYYGKRPEAFASVFADVGIVL